MMRAAAVGVLVVGLALLFAVGGGPMGSLAQAQAPTTVVFAASGTWYGQVPIFVAIDKGFFKSRHVEVDYRSIIASADRLTAVTSGAAGFSNLGRLAVISVMAQGNKAFYYTTNVDDSPGNEGCWARPGINSITDLKGRKVAANTSAQVTLSNLLADHGMTLRDIQYVNLSPTDMALALKNANVDAVCVWRPPLDQVRAAVPDGKLLGLDSDTNYYKKFKTMSSPDIMIINRQLADGHPDVAKAIMAASMQGADYTNQHPDETARTVAHYFKQPPDQVLSGITSFKYFGTVGAAEHMRLQSQQMQFLARWMNEQKFISSVPYTWEWAKPGLVTP